MPGRMRRSSIRRSRKSPDADPLLPVLAARLAHALERLLRTILIGFATKVAKAHNPAQHLLIVDDRQPAHPGIAHPRRNLLDIIVEPGADHVIGHQLAHWGVRAVS